MLWDPFFFFLNKVHVNPVNSAQNPLNNAYCLLKVETRASGKKKKKKVKHQSKCGKNYFCQLFLLFSLFLLLFIGSATLFSTIYESHYTMSNNFYIYLQYFQ